MGAANTGAGRSTTGGVMSAAAYALSIIDLKTNEYEKFKYTKDVEL